MGSLTVVGRKVPSHEKTHLLLTEDDDVDPWQRIGNESLADSLWP